jgi:predicted ribosomally synthesized peptide with nif11-like leader
MSEEQLKAFMEALKADPGLQERLKAAVDTDAVVAIAQDTGFVMSAEELKRAQAEVSERELESEELERLAGARVVDPESYNGAISSRVWPAQKPLCCPL